MFTLIIMAVGAVAAGIGTAVKAQQAKKAGRIGAEAQRQSEIMQIAQERLAARGQAVQTYTQALINAQQQAHRRQQLTRVLWFGLPLMAGVFLLLAVTMRKRKKGRKK